MAPCRQPGLRHGRFAAERQTWAWSEPRQRDCAHDSHAPSHRLRSFHWGPARKRSPLYLPNLPEQLMETSHFLQDVVMYLAAAVVAVSLSRRWGLGAVLGYLAAGALIGPYALNLARDGEATSQLSEFGVIMLLFVIGLELSPQRLWLMRKAVFGAGFAQVVLSGLLLGAAALGFGLGWRSALIV